ncbi:MAG: hypothetical protein QM756_18595 [Polyangiaceae bacterium]
MNSHDLVLVREDDLAVAWAKAFRLFAQPGVTEVSPLIVNIAGFGGGFPNENVAIRDEVRRALHDLGQTQNVCMPETTANTIFPESLWQLYRRGGRTALFEKYEALLPRLQKRDRRNHKGTYFSRMTCGGDGGQLGQMLDTWRSGVRRRSALQLVILDPAQDQNDQPFLGFPCLDDLTFTPDSGSSTLSVTALYATQWVFDRAYGNYLGLCRLGRFVAEEMGLRFSQLTCVASQAKVGDAMAKKKDIQAFAARLDPHLATVDSLTAGAAL